MKNGDYILIVAPEEYPGKRYRGRYAYEHHVVWWRNTGEVPDTGFVVHHKNTDKQDNRYRNLEKKTVSRHVADHHVPASMISLNCAWCADEFEILSRKYRERAKRGQKEFYCCRSHQVQAQQAKLRGSREFVHGTVSGYRYHRCRCRECRAATARAVRSWRSRNR